MRNHRDIGNFTLANRRIWQFYEKHKCSIFPLGISIERSYIKNKRDNRTNYNCRYNISYINRNYKLIKQKVLFCKSKTLKLKKFSIYFRIGYRICLKEVIVYYLVLLASSQDKYRIFRKKLLKLNPKQNYSRGKLFKLYEKNVSDFLMKWMKKMVIIEE